ncbi:hypothetical protein FJZ33_05020 [Candidatus Poribacteria bacterium]|nr:hypothetical protein [Candidatus Poribacteria bacterium]
MQYEEILSKHSEQLSEDPNSSQIWFRILKIIQSQSDLNSEIFSKFCEALAKAGKVKPIQIQFIKAKFYENHGEPEKAKEIYANIGSIDESNWMVIGPFDNIDNNGLDYAYPPEINIDLSATYEGKAGKVKWQNIDDKSNDGILDFDSIFTPNISVLAYALVDVISPNDRKAQLRIGSDDGVKVWLNGQIVWTNPSPRSLQIDQDIVPIELKKGRNRLLFKVDQGDGNWGLAARITDENGQALDDLQYIRPDEK